ncbi:MAG: hypothetical protein OYH77_08050 [Pseudomonadota bacterium]|nr:hypothetical protein [Pseudomonadota bacterium]
MSDPLSAIPVVLIGVGLVGVVYLTMSKENKERAQGILLDYLERKASPKIADKLNLVTQ